MAIHELPFEAPAGFEVSEVMLTLKGPAVDDLVDPRMLQKQRAIRPNLIVHRRPIADAATLDLVVAEMCAELLTSIPSLQDLKTTPFTFADGAKGSVVQFDFAAGKAAAVRQFQAVRVDAGALVTLTLTVDHTTLNDATLARYMQSLASYTAS